MAQPWSAIALALRREIDPASMQTRLTAGVVLASLVSIGSMTAWMGWRTRQILLDGHRQNAQMVADRFVEDVQYYADLMPPPEALQRVIDHRSSGDLALWVTTSNGELLAQSETLSMGSWQNSGITDDLLAMAMPQGAEVRAVQEWQFVVCAEALSIPGMPVATLHIANDITMPYRGIQRLVKMLMLTSVAIIPPLALAVALYIRRTLSPLRQLNRLASQVTADTLTDHQLSLQAAPTEVQELVRSYNLMLTRLAKAWTQQKRFVNDVSHELRTPLSLIQGYLESTLRRGSNLTPPQRQGLEIAAAETDRTVQLLTELLDLARLENGQLALILKPTNLVTVVQEAIRLSESDQTVRSRIVVECLEPPPIVKADALKLRTVLVELLNNALRYSPPPQPVQVVVSVRDAWATVQVQDQGVGIPATSQPSVFDPFYRVDENRAPTTGGTGLGLTLVRSLVEAMAGQVSLQSQPNQGSTFTITLPMEDTSQWAPES